MMQPKLCLLSLSAALLAGCIIGAAALEPIEKINTDHSLPVTGNLVETGALGYEEEQTGLIGFFAALFSKKEERVPVKGEILAKGSYKAQGEPGGIIRFAYPRKNKIPPCSTRW
jgi:hypothetical protein